MHDIYAFLKLHHIAYERIDHAPVFTCDEAEELTPAFDGTSTKNLFIKDKKGRRHFLISMGYEKSVDIKALSQILGAKSLSFASAERLQQYLGLDPGSVTLLGVINDTGNQVEVIIDEDLWKAKRLACHPLVNTSTLILEQADLARFLEVTNHPPRIIGLPLRQ